MAETHETIADIIAHKRQQAAYIVQIAQGKRNACRDKLEDEARDIRREADRLEAALKRERGNAAKLREALEKLYDQICHGETERHVAANRQMIRAALDTPLRNSDMGTAEEQFKRHSKWCARTRDFSCAATMCRKCFANWSQKPYEEGDDK